MAILKRKLINYITNNSPEKDLSFDISNIKYTLDGCTKNIGAVGFIRNNKTGKTTYINTEESYARIGQCGGKYLYRKADGYNDWSGGRNMFTNDLADIVEFINR